MSAGRRSRTAATSPRVTSTSSSATAPTRSKTPAAIPAAGPGKSDPDATSIDSRRTTMSKTLIAWPLGSVDGEREARRLQALYATVSDCVDGSGLATYPAGQHSRLIVVGHREEIEKLDTLKALVACVRSLGVTTVVMANCNSGQYKSGAALSDGNELW